MSVTGALEGWHCTALLLVTDQEPGSRGIHQLLRAKLRDRIWTQVTIAPKLRFSLPCPTQPPKEQCPKPVIWQNWAAEWGRGQGLRHTPADGWQVDLCWPEQEGMGISVGGVGSEEVLEAGGRRQLREQRESWHLIGRAGTQG